MSENSVIVWRPQRNTIYHMDALTFAGQLEPGSVQTVVTSPPYFGLRDYGAEDQYGLEDTPDAYVRNLVALFRVIRRALADDGTVWLNLGDTYATNGGAHKAGSYDGGVGRAMSTGSQRRAPNGIPAKSLVGIPWRVALALQADGWILRSDVIWHKSNSLPESVTDRPTKAHEYVFLLAKSPRYYYDAEAIKVPAADKTINRGPVHFGGAKGRAYTPDENDPNYRNGSEQWGRLYTYDNGMVNRRSVWTVSTQPFPGAHFAVFPPKLIEPCILAGAPPGGLVYDPFMGSGTTAIVAQRLGRDYVGSDLNADYVAMARERLAQGVQVDMFHSLGVIA